MNKLLGTTALAITIATSAFAQTATQPPAVRDTPAAAQAPAASQTRASSGSEAATMAWLAHGDAGDIHVSDMIGATIYAADPGEATLVSRDDWDSVGVVNDVLLTRQGEIRAVLVDVGTFLGMGGKTVAAPLDSLRYVTGSEVGEYYIVVAANRDVLQAAPAYERPSDRAADASANASSSSMFSYDGYDRAEIKALTVEDLEDANVYGHNDDEIGTISSLIVTKEGMITDAVIDVGGFLGMGERSVSMKFGDLTVLRQTGGDDVRVYIDATKEKLEAMPRYNR